MLACVNCVSTTCNNANSWLRKSLMWREVHERNRYRIKVSQNDIRELANESILQSDFNENFTELSYSPRSIPVSDTPKAVLYMFQDLGMMSRWQIRRETLAGFILMVKKRYRQLPYHNWLHAFCVTHFCYVLHKNITALKQYLTELESLSLFVACLCHDLDHRGTNNNFQLAFKPGFAAMYGSEGSVMEKHHFAQTVEILKTDGCNIFENLPGNDYSHCIDIIRDIILATDLTHHFQISEDLEKVAKEGYDVNNERHHQLLLCLLMTCCDLSDHTKEWEISKRTAELVYEEFFFQGDLEKAKGGSPEPMYNRKEACIPELQISFLKKVAQPVYELLTSFFPEAACTVEGVTTNTTRWECL